MSNKYLENRAEMKEGYVNPETGERGKAYEEPDHVVKAFTNCKTKVRHAVSKVIIEGNASDSIVKEILDWMGEAKPEVIYKVGK
tara:strand:- start:3427 stop:3678 length:252 start_codon:yes stop_codon:yes gene_type:complete